MRDFRAQGSGATLVMMSVIEETRDGPIIRVRVKSRAQRDAVLGVVGASLSVSVRAAPEKGKANSAVIATVSKWLGVPKSSLSLVSGASARDKRIAVHGIDATELRARIAALR